MAELNFGLLTPPGSQSIGNAFVTGMDQAQEARARDLQMQQSVRQGEVSQMQLQKMQRDATGLAEFSRKVSALGGPSDLVEIAKAYLAHPDIEMQKIGAGLMQKVQTVAAYEKANPPGVNALTPAAGAGPMPSAVAPEPGSFSADVMERREANPFAPRTNMLAGAPTEVNNLGAPPQVRPPIDALNARISANLALGTEQGYKTAEALQKQAAELSKLYPVGTSLMSGTGAIVGNAPEKPTAPPSMVAEYTFAKTPGGGDYRGSFQDFVTARAAAGRAPGTNLNVNTVVPASVEAQRDFMKSTRATYDTLKQSPAMFANIEAAKKLIPAASVFMGTGGEGMKAAASFLNNRLGMSINTEGVKTAEELRSRLFQGILANLKKLDSQPSERQQAALEQALGNLNTDPNALANVLDAYADTVRNNIDTHNAEVQSAISRGVKFPYDPIIKVPAKSAGPDVYVRDADGVIRRR